jgi:hypothetical protein
MRKIRFTKVTEFYAQVLCQLVLLPVLESTLLQGSKIRGYR